MRYIIENLHITQLKEIMQKKIDIHEKKYGSYQFRCVLKVNDNQYIKDKPMLNLHSIPYPYITVENQPYNSQVFEMRITLFSSHRHMTYDYNIKQPKPSCENKLTQLTHKNPQVINSLIRFIVYPFIQECDHISVPENYPS